MGRGLVLLVLAGCYAPSPTAGAPCSETLACPSAQTCRDGICQREGVITDPDAPPPGDADIDATLAIDALTFGWSAPVPIGITVGQSKSDASATPNRLVFVFARNSDLFIATRPAIGAAFTITPLPFNSQFDDKSPEISPDGNTLYFTSNPEGDYDTFVSMRVGTTWSTPVKVDPFSGPQNEQDLAISPDELTAFVAVGNDIRRSVRASKTAAWPAPTTINVTWGTSPTAPSINAAGDVYFHANNPRDLFVVRRQGNGYAAPIPVADVNTAAGREAAPFVSADDRRLMFERDGELVESTR